MGEGVMEILGGFMGRGDRKDLTMGVWVWL